MCRHCGSFHGRRNSFLLCPPRLCVVSSLRVVPSFVVLFYLCFCFVFPVSLFSFSLHSDRCFTFFHSSVVFVRVPCGSLRQRHIIQRNYRRTQKEDSAKDAECSLGESEKKNKTQNWRLPKEQVYLPGRSCRPVQAPATLERMAASNFETD